MATFTEVLARCEVTPVDAALAEIDVPVLCGPGRQGDVFWAPTDAAVAGAQVGPEGVQVVRGEATGNSHWLHADGPVFWAPAVPSGAVEDTRLGVLDVPEGSVAWLVHTDEHGCNGIGPGRYLLRGKRDLVGRVAD